MVSYLEGIPTARLGDELGPPESRAALPMDYLQAEGLLEFPSYETISITHAGVVEVEAALSTPAAPTEHFPAFSIVNIHDSQNVSVQSATSNSMQHVSILTVPEHEA